MKPRIWKNRTFGYWMLDLPDPHTFCVSGTLMQFETFIGAWVFCWRWIDLQAHR